MKPIFRYLSILSLLLFCIPFADAQSSVDLNIGFGTARSKASGSGIDNLYSAYPFGPCSLGSGDPYCQPTSALSGFFLGFGADAMLWKRFGIGGEVSLQPVKPDYVPAWQQYPSLLQYRETFYDFNGIFAPVNEKRIVLKLEGGIGAAKTGFSYNQNSCVGTAVVCSSSTQSIGSASHFQIHAGVGLQVFLTEHLFIRPQFDLRYVPGFTDQFGSSLVKGGMLWIGFRSSR